jgi:O-antigen ligase
VALTAMAALHWRNARVGLVLAGIAGAVGALLIGLSVLPVAPITRLASAFGLTSVNFSHYNHANFSEVERAAHWVAGLRMFASHPLLGVGIGNYPIAYQAYHVGSFTRPLGHAHNYFINIAAEAGILGLAAFVFFVVAAFSYILRSAADDKVETTDTSEADELKTSLTTRHSSSDTQKLKTSQIQKLRNPGASLPTPTQTLAALSVGLFGLWISSTFHNLFDVLYVHELPTLIGVMMGCLMATRRLEAGATLASNRREPIAKSQ